MPFFIRLPSGRRAPLIARSMHGNLIFDLDGTLVDSLPGIAASLNRGLARRGYAGHAAEEVRRFIGNGSFELARLALPRGSGHAEILALEAAFKEDYALTWPEGTAPYAGIPGLLEKLAAAGLRLAVLSNKPHPFTVEIVARLFPAVPFEPVLGHRPEAPRKPHPAAALQISSAWAVPAAECHFIGDSTVDLETARAAGMQPVAVAWGYHDRELLEAAGAGGVLGNPGDLASFFGAS